MKIPFSRKKSLAKPEPGYEVVVAISNIIQNLDVELNSDLNNLTQKNSRLPEISKDIANIARTLENMAPNVFGIDVKEFKKTFNSLKKKFNEMNKLLKDYRDRINDLEEKLQNIVNAVAGSLEELKKIGGDPFIANEVGELNKFLNNARIEILELGKLRDVMHEMIRAHEFAFTNKGDLKKAYDDAINGRDDRGKSLFSTVANTFENSARGDFRPTDIRVRNILMYFGLMMGSAKALKERLDAAA